ncbi:unnamed protein product [Blepharisma stoltei]|uniref:Uncharacterized protein n=1 Tax=Blepharisma stoltei TaxID=1481888 RepID=A0AAU9IAV7_9CILI|nr:unnamed protein product [Blepharisma stoltei]
MELKKPQKSVKQLRSISHAVTTVQLLRIINPSADSTIDLSSMKQIIDRIPSPVKNRVKEIFQNFVFKNHSFTLPTAEFLKLYDKSISKKPRLKENSKAPKTAYEKSNISFIESNRNLSENLNISKRVRNLSHEREFIRYGTDFQEIIQQSPEVKRSVSQGRKILKKPIKETPKKSPKIVNVSYSDLHKKKALTICNTPEPKSRKISYLTQSYDHNINNDEGKSFILDITQSSGVFKTLYTNIQELIEIRKAHLSLSKPKNNEN